MRKILIIVLLVSCSIINAQESGRNIFSIDDVIKIALEKNYSSQLYDSQLRAANADLTQSFGRYLPSADFTMGFQKSWVATSYAQSIPNNLSMGLNANMLIFDGFSREANYKRAQESFKSQNFNGKYLQLSIRRDVYSRYINVIKSMQIVKIRRENLELGKKELERTTAMFNAGILPVQSVYAQEADLGNKEYDLINSENQLKITKIDLMIYMGLYPNSSVEFLESSIPTNVNDDEINRFRKEIGTYSAALDKSIKSKPELKAYVADMEASKASLEVAKSGFMPSLNASFGWNWANSEFGNYDKKGMSSVGLNLHLPIFSNFTTNYQVENAQLRLKQSELVVFQSEQFARQEVQNAFSNLEAAEKSFEVSNRAVKSAKRNYDGAAERLRVGASNITDFITANAQLITSQINQINAIYSYIQAQKEILYSIGELK